MNLRQKAKHFKKLYEKTLYNRQDFAVHPYKLPVHYKIKASISKDELMQFPESAPMLTTKMINMMMQEIKPIVTNNLIVEDDIRSNEYQSSLDIWIS
jgi:hypothetical protein